MKSRRLNRDLPLSLAASAGLLLASFLLIRFSYEANDDLAMISILNGSYSGTPDGHAVFLGYPLSWLISLLYRTGIQISWYQLTMTLICLFAIASVCYRLLKRLPEHPVIACLLPVCGVALLWMNNLMRFTFSTCGAFVAAALILCFALQTPNEDLRPGALSNILLLLFFAYTIRDYFGYLSIAFLGAVWLIKYGKSMFRERRCWLIPLSALVVLGCAIGVHRLAYRDWSDFYQYNGDRSYLQDYDHFPDYETHQEFIQSLGYDKAAYKALTHYDYDLLPSYSPEVIHSLSEYAHSMEPEQNLPSVLKRTLKRAVDYYFVDSLSDLKPLQAASYLLPLALLVLSAVWSIRDRKWYILGSGLLLFGMGCCYLLIGYQGRYPSRVASSLRILVIGASLAGLALLFQAHPFQCQRTSLRRPLAVGGAVLLLLGTVWGFTSARSTLGAPGETHTMEYLSYIAQYPDNIYIRDTRSTQYNKDLLSEYPKITPNVFASGSWISYSPLYYDKLERMGLEELNRDTLFLDNVYLVVHEKYSLPSVLGVSSDTEIDYELIQSFDDGIQILKIHRIQE